MGPCPKCGQADVEGDKCPQCGVVVSLYRVYQEKLREGPRARAGDAIPIGGTAPMTWTAPPIAREAPPPMVSESGPSRRLFFHGNGGTLFGIQIVNAFLTSLTLGIYYFWAKVRVRRYLFGQTEVEGDRFEYHGTGKELFRGAVKAVLIFGVPLALVNTVPLMTGQSAMVEGLVKILSYVIFMTFFAVAVVGSRRYRLSRTSWRGIRFSFRGVTTDFIKLFLRGTVLSFLTLGLYTPIFLTRQYAFLTSNSYFGDRKFAFDGQGRDLFWPFVTSMLLAIPTLGLYVFWWLARQQRYFWDHTTFGMARFHSTVTGGGLLWLTLVNALLLIVTLGLAWPWITLRKIRYRLDHLTLEGAVDLGVIQQEAQEASATAEALGGFLDLDLGAG